MLKDKACDPYLGSMGRILTGKQKYFSRSIPGPSFLKLLETINFALPPIRGEGPHEAASNSTQAWDPAFLIYRWKDEAFPALI